MLKLVTHTAEETHNFGKMLSKCLEVGDVVALIGDLASGKTTLIKGICEGLNVKNQVVSPTFTLMNEYSGKYSVYHVDCYREQRLDEWLKLGINEYLCGNGVTLIEWADRISEALPDGTTNIFLDQEDEKCRYITVNARNGIENCISRMRFGNLH